MAPALAKDDRSGLGMRGEDVATAYLANKGYRILGRRWKSGVFGANEIDIVAEERGEIVFVEVKTRRGLGFGAPEEAVTAAKRAALRRAAWTWLGAHCAMNRPYRIDVIGVVIPADGSRPRLCHLESAVGEEG
ncbi:MAG: YraN family protein [Patescibacteria group bacterium]|nr:YraN family protein [Patescibacteria group bacterium]